MTRWSLATLLATTLAGPWVGCDHQPATPPPVTPPAAPPAERAPVDVAAQPNGADIDAIIFIDAAHRRG